MRAVLTGHSTKAWHAGVNMSGGPCELLFIFHAISRFTYSVHNYLFSNLITRSVILDLFLKDNTEDNNKARVSGAVLTLQSGKKDFLCVKESNTNTPKKSLVFNL